VQWVRPDALGGSIRCRECGEPIGVEDHIAVACPHCLRELRIGAKHFGHGVSCSLCNHSFRISRHPRVPCPRCGRKLPIEPDNIGRKIRCNYCEYSFISSGPSGGVDSGTIPILDPVPELAPGPDNEALRRRVQALEGEIGRIRDELSGRIAAHTQASVKLQEAENQLARLAELEARAAEAARLEQELRASQEEINRLRAALQQAPTFRGPPLILDESIRQEQERLRAERECAREPNEEAEQLRARIAELEQAASQGKVDEERWATEIERARLEGDKERKALEEEWRRAHRIQLGALEERAKEERARTLAELERQRRELEILRESSDRQLRDKEEEAKVQRIRAEELKRQRDAALEEIQAIQCDMQCMPQSLDAQRQALREQFEREHQDEIRGLEARLEETRELLRTERQNKAKRVPPPAEDFQPERQALQETIARLQQQAEALRRERDAAAAKLQELQQVNDATMVGLQEENDDSGWGTRLDVAAVCGQVEEREVQREVRIMRNRFEEQVKALQNERDAALERVRMLQQAAQTPEADRKAWEAQWRRENETQLQAAEQKAREQIEAAQKQAALEQRTLQLELDQCRQEIAAQRQWRESTVRQLESLWQERDQGAASAERVETLKREIEWLREERDVARERLRLMPPPAGHGVAVLVGIIAAALGALGAVGVMLLWNRW
jgi:hypothetical protein